MNGKRCGILLMTAGMPLWLSACAEGSGAEGGWEGTVRDSAGVEIVESTGGGVWAADEAWRVVPDLQIGAAMGEAHLQFGLIAGIDVGDDGRIYVIDQQASEVRVFDRDGGFLRSMGRAGSGPGELGPGAGPVFVSAGDTVVVPDLMNQRLSRWDASGASLPGHPLSMADGIATRWMKAPDGRIIQQSMIMALPNQPDVEPKNLLLRREATGALMDTLLSLPIGQTMDFASGQPTITLFESEPMWTTDPLGRLVSGNNSEYRLEVRGSDGALERIVARPGARAPLTEGDQAEFRRAIEGAWEQAGMPPEARRMMSGALRFARSYPAYANLLGGPDGTLWVQHVQTPETVREQGGVFDLQDTGGPGWDVFDSDGRFLGVVTMPPRFTPLLIVDDQVYGVLRDELDVQYATRMTIEGMPN